MREDEMRWGLEDERVEKVYKCVHVCASVCTCFKCVHVCESVVQVCARGYRFNTLAIGAREDGGKEVLVALLHQFRV
jgi:hypothetical protein